MVELALKIARRSTYKFRLGAVLAHRREVLSMGWNQMDRTHPAQLSTYDSRRNSWVPGLHAEVHACLGYEQVPRGSVMWVARVTRAGAPALARSCNLCLAFMDQIGVEKVFYTTGATGDNELGVIEL